LKENGFRIYRRYEEPIKEGREKGSTMTINIVVRTSVRDLNFGLRVRE